MKGAVYIHFDGAQKFQNSHNNPQINPAVKRERILFKVPFSKSLKRESPLLEYTIGSISNTKPVHTRPNRYLAELCGSNNGAMTKKKPRTIPP